MARRALRLGSDEGARRFRERTYPVLEPELVARGFSGAPFLSGAHLAMASTELRIAGTGRVALRPTLKWLPERRSIQGGAPIGMPASGGSL